MSRAIMQQALDALKPMKDSRDDTAIQRAITALEAELAEPEQDKPLKLSPMYEYGHIHDAAQPEQAPKLTDAGADTNIDPFTLYPKGSGMVTLNQVGMRVDLNAPPRKTWVGLTDDEVYEIANFCKDQPFNFYAKEIQTKLKELNT